MVKYSFNLISVTKEDPKSHDHQDEHDEKSFWRIIVIHHKGSFYTNWHVLYILCCFTSSYMYAYIACFKK